MFILIGAFNMTDFASRFLRQPQGIISLGLLTFLIVEVALGPSLAPYDPETFHIKSRLLGPSPEFFLGTDQFGRDILSRLLWGARTTILLSLLATLIGAVAGGVLGIISGYLGGRIDEVVMRFVDALMAIPSLLFALLIITVLGPSGINAVIAIGIAFSPGMARVARSVTLSVKTSDYVSAAIARGESVMWIMTREVAPNMLAPVIIEATIRVAFAIMLLATLSFLGLGSQPPASEWGLMISEGRAFMFRNGWTVVWPGLSIAIVAITFNLLGDALRDALNPKNG
jgi:peptide/nickel transport system permease protein